MEELVIVGTGTATDDVTGEEYTFPVFGLPDQEELAKLKSSIYPTLVECHAAMAATVHKMAAVCTEMGGDGEALAKRFPTDPSAAMEFLMENGFYGSRSKHIGGGRCVSIAEAVDRHEEGLPLFESHPSMGWIEVQR